MSKVIIDLEIFKDVLKTYFSSCFMSQLLDTMLDNNVFLGDCRPEDYVPWVSVDVLVPDDGDIYEVTAVTSSNVEFYREFAYFNSTTREWRSHFSGSLLEVVAWKPHTELFTVPFI